MLILVADKGQETNFPCVGLTKGNVSEHLEHNTTNLISQVPISNSL